MRLRFILRIAPPTELVPNSIVGVMSSRANRGRPGHIAANRMSNFLREHFPWIIRRSLIPLNTNKNSNNSYDEERQADENRDHGSRRKRFLFRWLGNVEDLHARRLFRFLHLRQLVLLREHFVDGLLNLGPLIEICPSNTENRQFTNRRIKFVCRRWRVGIGCFATK